MRLYVMRHGLAEDTSSTGKDRDRPLTASGRFQVEQVAHKLLQFHGSRLSRVVSSPYLRARETAEIMAFLAAEEGVEIDHRDELRPDEDLPGPLLRSLVGEGQATLLVGHHPMVITLLRALVRDVGTLPLGLHPGMLVGVSRKKQDAPERLGGTFQVATLIKP